MVVVGILWIPVIQGMQGACQFCATMYIVTVVSVAPCVCSIFVCVMVVVGILWIPVFQAMQGACQFCATMYIVTVVSVAPCVCSIFVCVMVVVGILWIPVIQGMQGAQLYFYIQAVSAYLAPPIASVYLLAVLWTRANERVTTSSSMIYFVFYKLLMVFFL